MNESDLNALLCVDDFELGQYYWCRFNCGWLIGRVNYTKAEQIADRGSWVFKATSLIDAGEYEYSLEMALKVFTGGVVKADTPDT